MRALLVIWQKVIIHPFYRDNTGFFFFWTMLLVIFQNPGNRLFIEPFLSSVIQTPVVLGVILGALFLYFLKCYQYARAKLAQPENEFLFITSLLPLKIAGLSWFVVFISLYAPALLYLGLLTWSSLNSGTGIISLCLISYNFVLAIVFTRRFTYLHRRLKTEIIYSSWLNIRLFPAFNQYLFIFFKFIWQEATGLFLLTKGFTLAVTWAFLKVYPPAEYGIRPAAIGFLIGLAGHSLLIIRTHFFEEERLVMLRQLPFNTWQRMLLLLVAYGFSLLPEGVFLLSYVKLHFPPWQVFTFYAFGLSFLQLLHVWQYRPVTQEKYYRQIFFLFISLLFLILFSVPLWVLAGLSFTWSLSLLRRYYYQFEATW